ncbi:phenylacetate--CoA ligase family protein [Flagellimonas pelagia]|uniref:Phenylacetate--CoA ligase family protein n=1 Tax=Flagellimonas pelagia TaxID=2306998 RepID=A0ABY3KL44_9FLAO|nr:phenylacetate--CoA ligase family protein [Allomuricauda maritima]
MEDFPIVDKQVVRDCSGDFQSLVFRGKHTHPVTTSGSTGKPFRVLHDMNKRDRNTADTCFFAKRAGYELGSRLFYLRLWDKQYQKNKLLTKIQNIAAYSVDDLTEERVGELIKELEQKGTSKNILAYTSALGTVCDYIENHLGRPLEQKINSIIAIAEGLSPRVKEKAEKYLGKTVVSRYSNSENGILAQQRIDDESGSFEINWASYHIELLDLNEDKPVGIGESGRIVITDFFNFSMPLIRYDTGDIGIMDRCERTGTLVFTKIEGRKMDMFVNTQGQFISSHIIHHILQFGGIDQFQFVIEENGEYSIKLKVTPFYDKNDESAIERKYREYLGQDAVIRFEYVNDIPLLASGKRKLVVNNFKPSKSKRPEDLNVVQKSTIKDSKLDLVK